MSRLEYIVLSNQSLEKVMNLNRLSWLGHVSSLIDSRGMRNQQISTHSIKRLTDENRPAYVQT